MHASDEDLPPHVKGLFRELREMIDPRAIDDPNMGIRNQWDLGLIDEKRLQEIVTHYRRLQILIDTGVIPSS